MKKTDSGATCDTITMTDPRKKITWRMKGANKNEMEKKTIGNEFLGDTRFDRSLVSLMK